MSDLIIPEKYTSYLSVIETVKAIKELKDFFEDTLAEDLNLLRVSAPLFVRRKSGLNDDLSGIEKAVSFEVKGIGGEIVEIVHSLAKWKRMALKKYNFSVGEGLYTDMNAIRKDEDLDNLHSIYVDQWDWEKIIRKEDRNIDTLKEIVIKIYGVFKKAEKFVSDLYPSIKPILPEEITFMTSQELEDKYPTLSPKEREDAAAKEHGAIFVIGIGDKLNSGEKHDSRSPDYDDWTLNGDILFWYPVLGRAMELSSMGIRVDEDALLRQLQISGCEERKELEFHQQLLNGELPYTVGGGIGQSRLCMFFLRKAHIGEVQTSVWSDDMIKTCNEANIFLL
ncbi:MAG TPA: aspartate--ammonia ligase [Defluviitaleaceae bacterium]|jgi:aspartate--ammonia ligase|nr:aspartate--ammonia ligase [Candidatus Epulonipiscium sp.]HOA81377.1 aspartate--ammonia ligase [Defluviitaleaceae bacterium]